jgi:hypothetical protein
VKTRLAQGGVKEMDRQPGFGKALIEAKASPHTFSP